MKHSEIIELFGGPAAFEMALRGEAGNMVAMWKSRGYIPRAHWPEILRLADARGIDCVNLKALMEGENES